MIKKKIGVKAYLDTHVTTQMQLESQLNFAMFVSSHRVPTILRCILEFYLASFDVFET